MQSLEANLVEAQKSSEDTKLERKTKDEKIAEQDNDIQQLRNEIEKMKSSHSDNISRLDLEVENLKHEVKTKVEENS